MEVNIIDTSKFSWNEFEQNLFQDGKWEIPSKYKIKINDSSEKRYKLEMILYKMSHKYVARWALENAQAFLSFIEIGDKELKESFVCETTAVLNMRIDGKSSAYKLRNAGFLANKLGQMSINDLSKYSARVFAHSIATGHMRGHAIVSSDYAIKVINILFPNDNLKVEEERNRQIELANKIIKEYDI